MTVEDEGRQKAIKLYRVIVTLMGVVSVVLLVCALLAVTKYKQKEGVGYPYYIGGFIGGIMGLVYVCLCTCIIIKVPHFNTDDIKKGEVGCAMMGQFIFSMFLFMGCFIGVIFAGNGAVAPIIYGEEQRDPAVLPLALCILIGCIIVFGINLLGMFTICTYGVYFGVHISKHRRRVIIVNQHPGAQSTMFSTPTTTTTSDAQIRNLETRNRLLQQQLQLQQRLNQQQSSTGNYQSQFTYPQPPPSYSDPSYPPPSFSAQPTAPPPSYDRIV